MSGVIESTNMKSTRYAERIFDAVCTTDVENGTFGYLDGLATGESHTYNFVKGLKKGSQIVVADNPAWSEDTSFRENQRKDKYVIPAGTRFRVRVIAFNDEFAINKDCVTTATQANLAVGAFLTIDTATGKLVASDTKTDDAAFEAEIMRTRMQGATISTVNRDYGYSTVMYTAKVEKPAVNA